MCRYHFQPNYNAHPTTMLLCYSFSSCAELYRDVETGVPDKLELNFTLHDRPVQLILERSDSIPSKPPVIVAQNHRRTYWTREPGSVSISQTDSSFTVGPYKSFTWIGSIHGLDWVGSDLLFCGFLSLRQ